MIIYSMTNVSSFALYFLKYRDEFNIFRHAVIPAAGIVVMFFPLAVSLAPQVFFGPDAANAYPFNLGLPITIGWFVIGLVVYFYLKATRPANLDIMANEMATVELAGEEFDPRSRATAKGAEGA